MRIVTAQMLRDADACPKQLARFEARFPKGIPVTEEAAFKAWKLGLDVLFARTLLSAEGRRRLRQRTAVARKKYLRECRLADRRLARYRERAAKTVLVNKEGNLEMMLHDARSLWGRQVEAATAEYIAAVIPELVALLTEEGESDEPKMPVKKGATGRSAAGVRRGRPGVARLRSGSASDADC